MSTLAEIISKVKESSDYLRYKKVIDACKGAVNLSQLEKEAGYMHSKRESPKLYKVKLDPTTVAKAALLDLSTRARLTGIRADLHRQSEIIATANSRLRHGFRAQWENKLKRLAGTAIQRTAIVSRLLADGEDLLSQIEATSKLLDSYIKDIDQAGYSLTNTTNLLKLLIERRDQAI